MSGYAHVRSGVNLGILTVGQPRPIYPQLQTYRCNAPTEAMGQKRSWTRIIVMSAMARPGGPAYGLATELADTFKAIPVVTGGELISSRPVFTRLVLITAHAKSIDANRHMMANRPVYLGLWRGAF
jgi:hypothetical protein